MKRVTRFFALLLCVCAFIPMLAACGGDNGKTTTAGGTVTTAGGTVTTTAGTVTTTAGTVTTAAPVTTTGAPVDPFRYDEDGYVLDNIPDNVDFDERIFNALVGDYGLKWQFPATEFSTDVIQTEVFSRVIKMEERLNCRFAPEAAAASWGDQASFLEKASKAGEEKKDFIITYSLWPAVLAQRELLVNLNSLEFPQMEMPWWPENMSEWTQYGTLFFCSNSVSAMNIYCKIVLFADTIAIAEKGMDDVLDLVLEKKWTADKFATYVAAFHDDAVAAKTAGTEYYGLVVDDRSRLDAFYYGSGLSSTKNDNRGIAKLAFIRASDVDQISAVADKFISILAPDESYIGADDTSFMQNRTTAFEIAALGTLFSTNDSHPYAALPEPMWNERQGKYCVISNNGYEVMCIPVGAADPEASGVVLETISSLDYRMVAPVFFEDKLKNRYARSDAGKQIFDLLLESAYIDFGRVNYVALTSIEDYWRGVFTKYGGANQKVMVNNFAQSVATLNLNRQLENKLTDLLQIYKKNGK